MKKPILFILFVSAFFLLATALSGDPPDGDAAPTGTGDNPIIEDARDLPGVLPPVWQLATNRVPHDFKLVEIKSGIEVYVETVAVVSNLIQTVEWKHQTNTKVLLTVPVTNFTARYRLDPTAKIYLR